MSANGSSRAVLLGLLLGCAGAPAWAGDETGWRFWKSADGLAEAFTGAISVRPDGSVLVGHGNVYQMERFDGYEMRALTQPQGPNSLFDAPDGSRWAVTNDGSRCAIWAGRAKFWV
jgi:hypothetical protein